MVLTQAPSVVQLEQVALEFWQYHGLGLRVTKPCCFRSLSIRALLCEAFVLLGPFSNCVSRNTLVCGPLWVGDDELELFYNDIRQEGPNDDC